MSDLPGSSQGDGLLRRLWALASAGGELVWLVVAAGLLVVFGLFSVKDIEPGEVAVKVNNITGTQSAVTKPGWTMRVPFVHSVYVLDAKPLTFSLKGQKRIDDLHVPELSVRASDGSNFHFTDTTIIFQLAADKSVQAVQDGGRGSGFIHWMRPVARSILRDEFGRESTINVSNPTTYGAAAARAKQRLNKRLDAHGVIVTQLVTPRPRFNQSYEKAIEDRNALSNELEVIKSNLDRAKTNRDRVLAEVDQQHNKVIQQTRANLESDLARAAARQSETKSGADTYRIATIAEGQAALSGSTQRAKELQGELEAKYQAKHAEIAAFRTQPVERVMEKLGEKLKGVTIAIQPWADDARPQRVKLSDGRAAR